MPLHPVPTPGRTTSIMRAARVSASLGALFLAACGGSVSTEPPPAEPTTVTLSTQVLDATGSQAVSGATVSVATKDGSATLALNNGSYSARVEVAQLPARNSGVPVVITISKAGFLTETVQIAATDIVAGRTVNVPTAVTLDVVPDTTLIAADSSAITRLGNGVTENAGLQSGTVYVDRFYPTGTGRRMKLDDFTQALAAYQSMTLSISFRGVDASQFRCADQVAVFQTADTTGARINGRADVAVFTAPTLPDSESEGSVSNVAFPLIPTTSLNTGNGPLWVEIKSGACASSGNDLDDFEFFDVKAMFTSAAPV